MISIIIPAYKCEKYIDECISSINVESCEILIGVDNCPTTLTHLQNTCSYDNVRIFYFSENVGPYVIKNTLVDEAKFDKLLFFDADDVMVTEMVGEIYLALDEVDYVKLNYINFDRKINKTGHMMNDAVIAINKSVFNSLNGFYPWKCAADTEFHERLKYTKKKSKTFHSVCYYRRLHGENLTMRKETGHGSIIRKEYVNIINRNIKANYWPSPKIKTIKEYVKD